MAEQQKVGSLIDQLYLERQSLEKGRDRYLERRARLTNLALDNTHGRIMDEAILRVSEALKATVADASEVKKGRQYTWLFDLQAIDLDLVAYIGLSTCMEGVSYGYTRTKCLRRIGERIEMEYWSAGLKEYDRKLAKRLEDLAIKNHSSQQYRRKSIMATATREGYKPERWTEERQIKAAAPVFNAILEYSQVFEVWSHQKGEKTVYKIGLQKVASDRIADIDMEISWHQPILSPMVVPPKGWVGLNDGCYIDPAMAEYTPLVRHSSGLQRKMLEKAIHSGRMQPALDALNGIQRTPYEINTYVYDAVLWCWDNDKTPNGFPKRNYVEDIEYPEDYDSLSDGDKKGWRIKSRGIRDINRKIDSNRSCMFQDLTTAKEMSEFECFYIPHNFDFRGRVYPVSVFNHHREDHIRSMFYLHRAKPVDQDALQWIAFACANAGDFDKISKKPMAERIQWVEDNQDWILEVGRDFEATYDKWKDADKPFAFLAACRELYRYTTEEDFVSGLPIGLDGSNSGVQHFAALGLSETDGQLVNLIPSDRPQDIYQTVADRVVEKLQQSTHEQADEWIKFGIGRKLVKRNVMTFGYSATKFGFKDQILEDTLVPLQEEVYLGQLPVYPFEDKARAATVLAEANWDAVNEVVIGAREGMNFFRELAGMLAHRGKFCSWYTPVGFPVVNYYRPFKPKKLKVYLFDREAAKPIRSNVTLSVINQQRIDKKKAKSSISPNIIHSLDSSHLMSTVLEGLQNDIRDFMLIHDSFATVPADTWKLFHAVRKTFVEQYENTCLYTQILEDSTRVLGKDHKVELPKIPRKGNLDLQGVKDSMYCFA